MTTVIVAVGVGRGVAVGGAVGVALGLGVNEGTAVSVAVGVGEDVTVRVAVEAAVAVMAGVSVACAIVASGGGSTVVDTVRVAVTASPGKGVNGEAAGVGVGASCQPASHTNDRATIERNRIFDDAMRRCTQVTPPHDLDI
jgi:hypothetical protein